VIKFVTNIISYLVIFWFCKTVKCSFNGKSVFYGFFQVY